MSNVFINLLLGGGITVLDGAIPPPILFKKIGLLSKNPKRLGKDHTGHLAPSPEPIGALFYVEEGESMEKTNWLTAITAAVAGFFSWMVDGFGLPFTLLCGFMAADYFTGVMVAIKKKGTEGLSSKIGFVGLLKKIYIAILLGAIKGLDVAVLNTDGFIYDGAAIAFIVNEFISITENGGKMGVWMPEPVKKVIRVLKEKEEVNKDAADHRQDQSS